MVVWQHCLEYRGQRYTRALGWARAAENPDQCSCGFGVSLSLVCSHWWLLPRPLRCFLQTTAHCSAPANRLTIPYWTVIDWHVMENGVHCTCELYYMAAARSAPHPAVSAPAPLSFSNCRSSRFSADPVVRTKHRTWSCFQCWINMTVNFRPIYWRL